MTSPRLVWVCECGNTPCDGLDCGVDDAPRKKPAPKTPAEMRSIRAKAWDTRRAAIRKGASNV
jgi:hypothetical protein